jgi:hypothetical protein
MLMIVMMTISTIIIVMMIPVIYKLSGKSYLRIEDYYCYAATAMNLLADMQEDTVVVKPFDPVKLQSD